MKIRIGIDPDVDKSGYAVMANGKLVSLDSVPFFEMLFRLVENKASHESLTVYIEAGWANKKSNFHAIPEKNKKTGQVYTPEQRQRMAGRMGKNVGANHVIGQLLVEWCKRNEIPHELVVPTKERGKKLGHEDFCRMAHWNHGRTNQDERDAAMLILGKQ